MTTAGAISTASVKALLLPLPRDRSILEPAPRVFRGEALPHRQFLAPNSLPATTRGVRIDSVWNWCVLSTVLTHVHVSAGGTQELIDMG